MNVFSLSSMDRLAFKEVECCDDAKTFVSIEWDRMLEFFPITGNRAESSTSLSVLWVTLLLRFRRSVKAVVDTLEEEEPFSSPETIWFDDGLDWSFLGDGNPLIEPEPAWPASGGIGVP